ncbi:hypothetical protein MSIMFB_03267 [Mycobacterium simulans]|uniref:Uncharacterized protein n=1 Tax=Mycobacterium simulans TaxID=627089 RepID=A0A7Z7NBC4_9MYCO|nr:hypothetical protein MSIMFB_03267 [Mycobacterium simulans]SON61937.1 hypothetical protein MSIMFI_03456 [Mycobacterium simulans]
MPIEYLSSREKYVSRNFMNPHIYLKMIITV